MKIKVDSCIYYRSGVSGLGFYALEFNYEDKDESGQGVAIVDAEDVELFNIRRKKRYGKY